MSLDDLFQEHARDFWRAYATAERKALRGCGDIDCQVCVVDAFDHLVFAARSWEICKVLSQAMGRSL